jgi:acylphosphatase
VTGRVQGVFYRASTQERALALGLTGWVRNCQNGDVELVACGGAPALEALERWLWQGPPAAQVSAVVRRETDDPSYAGFDVRR